MSLIVSTAPHVRSSLTTRKIMLNVVVALLPCAAAGIYYFGYRAAIVLAVSMLSAVLSEFIWQKATRQRVKISDCSALVTGLLVGLTVTPTAPWWLVMIGSIFAIIVVKQLFGGIGDNFLNPALAARAVLLASWPARMTAHIAVTAFPGVDIAASATPLVGAEASIMQLLMGNVPGAIGETCKIAIILGFVYLLLTETITFEIPVITVASAFVLSYLLGMDPVTTILSGGLLFGAVFMATDYATSPMHRWARVLYAIGIGCLTVLIRKFGAYPEGVTYAILFMNILTPLLDRMLPNRVYGHSRKKEAK
ncbi:MAG: RnfABCDGE type electron transport complex subunit D [Clostridiales bacterium]|nr:RnfABCDGE type electron transport complex subunit D [Clostridiales bacterium]